MCAGCARCLTAGAVRVACPARQVVKRALVVALDRDHATQSNATALLKYLHAQGVVSTLQMSIGFGRVQDVRRCRWASCPARGRCAPDVHGSVVCAQELPDISLDQPQAPTMFAAFVAAAKAAECLPADWNGHASPVAPADAAAPPSADATATGAGAAGAGAAGAEPDA